ncbi:MAG: MBL fold metallo-hydrolase [Chloroflexi bacterium]|nr:MBL fold metallo-hydrolase [Chloroflexota bacterium]
MKLEVHPIKLRMSNAYVVEFPSAMVLIDAGSPGDAQKILSRLNAFRGKPLRLIYITHAHLDHYGAAASIQCATNAPVAIHTEDAGTMAKGETHLGQVRGRGRLTAALMPIVRRLFPVESITADHVIHDGQDLGDFGLPGQVLHTPGHTPGSTSLIVDGRLAFVGDLFSTFGKPHTQRLYAHDWSEIEKSLERLKELDLEWLYPGHGRRPLSGEEFASLASAQQ